MFDVNPHFFNDYDFAQKYKKMILKYVEKPNIYLFEHYHFTQNDKDFLISLLNNTETRYSWRAKYSELSKIPGFSNVLTKYEYYEKYGNYDLEGFSDGEVEKNADFFKKVWSSIKEKHRYYEFFNGYITHKTSIKQFNAIMDEDLTKEILKKMYKNGGEVARLIGYVDAEYNKEIVDKRYYLVNNILNIYVKNDLLGKAPAREVIELESILLMVKELVNERYEPTNPKGLEPIIEKINANLQIIYTEVLPKYLKSDKFIELIKSDDEIFNSEIVKFSENFVKDNININNFYLLTMYLSKISKGYDTSTYNLVDFLTEQVKDMHAKLISSAESKEQLLSNQYSVNLILKSITNNTEDRSKSFFKELLKKTPKVKSKLIKDDYNFLAYEGKDLLNMNGKIMGLIYDISPDFSRYIIDNKIYVNPELIFSCLYRLTDSDKKFLKRYVKIHREEIEKDEGLKSAFLSSSAQSDIFPLNSLDYCDKYFEEMNILLDRIRVCGEKRDQLERMFDKLEFGYSRESKGFKEIDITTFDENIIIPQDISENEAHMLAIDFYEKKQNLSEELDRISNIIPYSFITQKIEQYIKDKNFYAIHELKEKRLNYNNEPIAEYIRNLDFKQLMEDLNDISFFELLKEQKNSYEDEMLISFKSFSYEENMVLAKKLLSLYRREREGKEDSNYTYGFLSFFKPENRDFIKEFAIENLPMSVFYSYDFLPPNCDTYKPKNYITKPYTVEEIYRVYKKLENDSGFLSYSSVNADYKHFLEYALFGRQRNRAEIVDDTKYKEILEFAKNNDPMFYAILAHQSIFSQLLEFGHGYNGKPDCKFKTKDEAINNYFNDNFDLDVILKGLDIIINKMKDHNRYSEENYINEKLAGSIIYSIVHNTYYEEYENYQNREYKSVTSKEDTIKLMKFLYEKAPQYFIERHQIGCAIDLPKFFKENIDEFLDLKRIENFILPDDRIYCEYFKVHNEDSEQRKRLYSYINVIIETAIERKDSKVIEYLEHLVKQNKFIEKEMDHSKKYKAYGNSTPEIIKAISGNRIINEMLSKAILKIELDDTLMVKESVVNKTRKI